MVWYGMVWYGMVWYGMVWYGMAWYGMPMARRIKMDEKLRTKLIHNTCRPKTTQQLSP
jgi:hypothetical protein